MAADEIAEREAGPHFPRLLGTEWLDDDPDEARARIAVRDELLQPFGILHGGVMSSLVESVCSRATARVVLEQGMAAMGQSISVNFLRPVVDGSIEARCRARHRGRTTWVWDAEVRDSADRLCAIGQMTVAVRPFPTKAD